MDAQNYIRCVCEGCNTAFDAVRPKRYCTRRCNKAHLSKIGSRQSRADYLSAARSHALEHSKHYFYCACCWKLSYRKLSGSNAERGSNNKYCSMACRSQLASKIEDERAFFARLSRQIKERGLTAARRRLAMVLAKLSKFRSYAQKPCLVCGECVGYEFGRVRAYCSQKCARQTPAFKSARKASRDWRKALKRGANGGENVVASKVFLAAGWKCQICNKPTPQRLRGTTHKRAPELDHIVPLSKGGLHTYVNTQCACRECNQWKSDRVVVGQMGLFAAMPAG